jgi:hypothetical protein
VTRAAWTGPHARPRGPAKGHAECQRRDRRRVSLDSLFEDVACKNSDESSESCRHRRRATCCPGPLEATQGALRSPANRRCGRRSDRVSEIIYTNPCDVTHAPTRVR